MYLFSLYSILHGFAVRHSAASLYSLQESFERVRLLGWILALVGHSYCRGGIMVLRKG